MLRPGERSEYLGNPNQSTDTNEFFLHPPLKSEISNLKSRATSFRVQRGIMTTLKASKKSARRLPESARATPGTKPFHPPLSRAARRAKRVYRRLALDSISIITQPESVGKSLTLFLRLCDNSNLEQEIIEP